MGFEPGNSELNPTDLPYTPQRQLTFRVLKHDVVLQVQRTAYFSIMFQCLHTISYRWHLQYKLFQMHVPLMAFHVPFTVNFLLSIKKHAWFNVNWIGVMVRKGTLPEDSESMGSNPDLINCFFSHFFSWFNWPSPSPEKYFKHFSRPSYCTYGHYFCTSGIVF